MKLLLFVFILFYTSLSFSQWRLEGFLGDAYNFPTELTIKQEGYPEIKKQAQWSTRPLKPAPYYSLRVAKWEEGKSWEVEMLHHKLYLDNTDSEIFDYRSTFGFNFFFVNKAWVIHPYFILRFGGGPVISHPISNIRGYEYTDEVSYKLVGVGIQGAIQSRQEIINNLFFTQETKITAATANIPIAKGESHLTNYAIHLLAGFSYDF